VNNPEHYFHEIKKFTLTQLILAADDEVAGTGTGTEISIRVSAAKKKFTGKCTRCPDKAEGKKGECGT